MRMSGLKQFLQQHVAWDLIKKKCRLITLDEFNLLSAN